MLFLWLCSVSDSTQQTGAVLRTSIQAMEEVILNFPGKMDQLRNSGGGGAMTPWWLNLTL